jgi:hypothetical protein
MTTKRHKEAIAAIEAWCKKRKNMKLTQKPRHVHPRAYVIGHAASGCLIVLKCWTDSEPHLREHTKLYPLSTINEFDDSLKAGDWCIVGYCSIEHRGGWPVAVPIPKDAT